MPSNSAGLGKAVLFAILSPLVATLAAATVKYLTTYMSVGVIVLVQYAICLLTLAPWLRRAGWNGLQTLHWKTHLIRGLSGWLCFYSYFIALQHIPLVEASLLRNTAPICVPFLVWFLTRSAVTWPKLLGILTGFAGVVLILHPEGSSISLWHGVGFISGITLALSMVYTRELASTESSNLILFYYFLISTVMSLPLAAINLTPIPFHTLPFLAFVGVSIYITMQLYTIAYSGAPTNTLAPFSYFGVVFAGILGWLFWDQIPELRSLVGMACVIAGGVITLLIRDKSMS